MPEIDSFQPDLGIAAASPTLQQFVARQNLLIAQLRAEIAGEPERIRAAVAAELNRRLDAWLDDPAHNANARYAPDSKYAE